MAQRTLNVSNFKISFNTAVVKFNLNIMQVNNDSHI